MIFIPILHLFLTDFHQSRARRIGCKGFLSLLVVRETQYGNAAHFRYSEVIALGYPLGIGTINLYCLGIFQQQGQDAVTLQSLAMEMDKGKFRLHQLIGRHVAFPLVGSLANCLYTKHHRVLLDHRVKMKQLPDARVDFVISDNLFPVTSLRQASRFFLSSQYITIVLP